MHRSGFIEGLLLLLLHRNELHSPVFNCSQFHKNLIEGMYSELHFNSSHCFIEQLSLVRIWKVKLFTSDNRSDRLLEPFLTGPKETRKQSLLYQELQITMCKSFWLFSAFGAIKTSSTRHLASFSVGWRWFTWLTEKERKIALRNCYLLTNNNCNNRRNVTVKEIYEASFSLHFLETDYSRSRLYHQRINSNISYTITVVQDGFMLMWNDYFG